MKSGSAAALAEELEATYKSPGFKILWDQYWREVRRAEQHLMSAPIEREGNPSKVAMETKYRRGFLDGIMSLDRFHRELLEVLKAGRVPWVENKRA